MRKWMMKFEVTGDLGVQAGQFLDGGLQIRADGAFAFFQIRFAGVVQLEVGREFRFGLPAFVGSWTIVLLGLCVIFYQGNRIFGVDFAGGDTVTVHITERLPA